MHVDGFRFDLGTILAREPDGFDNQSGFLKACNQDPVFSSVKLIAEPWDCGPGGYQVGGFPPGWAEWNDRFRDTVRDFWKGSAGASTFAPRLCASRGRIQSSGPRPWACVNFITAHDGFTLNDLVTYNEKHNEANGEDNQRRHIAIIDPGIAASKAPTDDPSRSMHCAIGRCAICWRRYCFRRARRCCLAGDEFGRTQNGNNNAYCQDSDISWINWDIGEKGQSLIDFVTRATELRRRFPILRRGRFLTEAYNEELDVKELTWVNASGNEMKQEDWDANGQCVGLMLDGRAQPSGIKRRSDDATLLLVYNAWHDVVEFTLPQHGDDGQAWALMLDTNLSIEETGDREFAFGHVYAVTGRSFLLFALTARLS